MVIFKATEVGKFSFCIQVTMSDFENIYEDTHPDYGVNLKSLKPQALSSASQERMLEDKRSKKKPSCDKVYLVWLVLLSILAGVGLAVTLGSIISGNSASSDNSDAIQALRQDLVDASPGPDTSANADAIQLLREELEAADADAASNISSLQNRIDANADVIQRYRGL